MSKAARKPRPSQRHTKPHKPEHIRSAQQQSRKQIVAFVVIAILAAVPFGFGKYFEFNSPSAFDAGAYVYSATRILNGARIGIDEKPSAQLGTLLVNMLGVLLFGGFSEIGPKVLQMLFQAAALVLMFAAMRKLFGTLSAAVGVIVASVCLSSPLIAKFGNVKEQYMIAFMMMGISCFVLYLLGGKWWWAVLAGAFLSWAPLFKATGTSAVGAIGLFVILQPVLKHRTFKQTAADIGLLLTGVAAAIGPLYLWILAWNVQMALPYSFVWETLGKLLPTATGGGSEQVKQAAGYIGKSRELVPFSQQWPKVLRYYGLLILPVALAAGAIAARILRMIWSIVSPQKTRARIYDRFVLLFAVWWLLDMAFVWISPRSYEQYYLPLNASAAMAGGYLIALYSGRLPNKPTMPTTERIIVLDVVFLTAWVIAAWLIVRAVFQRSFEDPKIYQNYSQYRMIISAAVIMLGLGLVGLLGDRISRGANMFRWVLVGIIGLACMLVMVWHIFFGVVISPFSGWPYSKDLKPEKGYAQKLEDISLRRKKNWKQSWETVGDYIRIHSGPTDKIYVWGWVPGIYVKAQRFSSASRAFSMPRPAPDVLAQLVASLMAEFEREKPKFIVDTRKRHIPMERPPYELWPIAPTGFMEEKEPHFLRSKAEATAYDKWWTEGLRKTFDEEEAQRYEAMAPFRQFVMDNYRIVEPGQFQAAEPRRWQRLVHQMFGDHVLFELKKGQ